ncbi:uncharacterized protein MELLADRAFT_46507 [Melampsora larici-populina 98AG31]|uniref:HECT-type E3 ubiquitin transferase n=1 Tax=Melampsora larici-populina (strain 98AG31 / pathotype 3-4-7) TaxID=747676 RepID=F4R663_MELLP|nr:uncharacterized protein MELLADRAFT_46507 [Melampsora larici-populina 98AG31]EGG12524.1 hypothetical protein MELLADRAFT_46507 [Melampsora larici-populina 98AG31]
MITAASRVMSLLFAANLRCKKIKVDNFYNTAIDLLGSIDLAADFERWETSASSYALCGYPCLLSIGAKITMLTHEGKRQMGAEARQALVDGLLGRRALAPVLQLNIRRNHLVEDSLRQIERSRGELKKLLKICFVGEDGLDGGGLKKEWFLLLIRQLVGPEYGMFIHDPDSNQLWFNPASQELGEFRLIGTVIGLAIYNRATLDISLPLVCYKKLLGQNQVSLADLEIMRPLTARGLRQLLEWDHPEMVEEIFCRSMVGEYEDFDGTVIEVPLVPNGSNIPVTGSNREEFVELYVDFLLNVSVQHQFMAFKEGFDAVAAGNALSLFQPEEIELVVSGSRERLDVDELSSRTEYENYQSKDLTILSFWSYMKSLNRSEEKKILSFITGTDRIPTCGLKFKISREFDLNRLPSSHTCFNQLVLPDLLTVQKVSEKLWIAMNESEGFGLN